MSIESDLRKSMAEELEAARRYHARGLIAAKLGFPVIARRYEHIRGEEIIHYHEFKALWEKARRQS